MTPIFHGDCDDEIKRELIEIFSVGVGSSLLVKWQVSLTPDKTVQLASFRLRNNKSPLCLYSYSVWSLHYFKIYFCDIKVIWLCENVNLLQCLNNSRKV